MAKSDKIKGRGMAQERQNPTKKRIHKRKRRKFLTTL